MTRGRAVSASGPRDGVSQHSFSPCGLAIPSQAPAHGGINGSGLRATLLRCCCCLGVVFIIEQDIKRFMVYSYRRCSGWRSVEIDTAITAGLVMGCDSHMLRGTKVAVAGGVPPARRVADAGLHPRRPCGGSGGTLCPPATSPSEGERRNCSRTVCLTELRYEKKKNSNFRSAMRARIFYKICLSLSSAL